MPPRPAPLVHVETLKNPGIYTPAQIREAFTVALALNRGKLVLCEAPATGRDHDQG